ncbi:hypothetical protein ABZ235_09810 [Streptomyces canus]|uniref:hypothetical protein n=1 Tax=Streptomyces canus TaxID=58343 RepID=UPI0033A3677E
MAALAAALTATASAEYDLARAVGFGEFTAACIPASLDVYALRAFAVRRDVPAVVCALIITNALAHLVSSGHLAASVPLVVAVSAVAPLVLWRVKALSAPLAPQESTEPIPEPGKPEQSAQEPSEPPVKRPEAKPDPLLPQVREFADKMHSDSGKSPSLRELQAHFSIGQARAQRIRVQLAGGAI